jgi:hypothetical protein
MDGLTTADRVKCKTILISAKPEAGLASNQYMVGFLKKPIRAHELLWVVKSLAGDGQAEVAR